MQKLIEKIEEFRGYVNQFEIAAAGIEEIGRINKNKEGDMEYFFESMGVLARDKDVSSGELIQFIGWDDFVSIVHAEANAASAHLKQMEMELEEKINESLEEDSVRSKEL